MEAGLKALKDGEEDYAELVAEGRRRADALAAYQKTVDGRLPAWEAENKRTTIWDALDVVSATSTGGAVLKQQPDRSILATGKNPTPESYVIKARTQLKGITGIRLEVLTDPSLPANGPGRAPTNGNFVLNEFQVQAVAAGSKDKPAAVALQNAQADFSQASYAVAGAIDGNPTTGWAISPAMGKPHQAYFELKSPLTHPAVTELTIMMLQQYAGKEHNIGRFRLSVTASPLPLRPTGPPENIARILQVEAAKRTPQQQAELLNYFRSLDPQWVQLTQAVGQHQVPVDRRQPGAQDLVWALLNSKAFQFNH
jgi:hypothetical protein